MKKLKVLSVLAVFFLSFFWTLDCFSEFSVLEKNERGQYREYENFWQISEIMAEAEALPYKDYFNKAIENKGEFITVWRIQKEVGFKFMFKKILDIKEGRIIYNKREKLIKYRESSFQEEENSIITIFFYSSLLFMILSNILFYKNKERKAIFSSVLSNTATESAFISFFLIVSFYLGAVFVFQFENLGTFLFYVVLIAIQIAYGFFCSLFSYINIKKKREIYKISSFIYYFFTSIAFFFIFIV